jgi:hypothetical protein
VCSPMTAAATREASGLIRPEVSTRTATISLLCSKRSTWRLHMWRRTLWGGNIALRLATRRSEVFRSLSCHEPPLWSLLEGDAESHEMLQRGARSVEKVGRMSPRAITRARHATSSRRSPSGLAPGTTSCLPGYGRSFVQNAPIFLDELQDRESARRRPGGVGARGGTGAAHRGLRESAGVPAGDRSARGADAARHPRDHRWRSARAPAVDPRALSGGDDAGALQASVCPAASPRASSPRTDGDERLLLRGYESPDVGAAQLHRARAAGAQAETSAP